MTEQDLDIVGVPSTVVSWLSMLQIISIGPMLNIIVSLMSLTWLSMQIYGWVEKRIKDKKNAS